MRGGFLALRLLLLSKEVLRWLFVGDGVSRLGIGGGGDVGRFG